MSSTRRGALAASCAVATHHSPWRSRPASLPRARPPVYNAGDDLVCDGMDEVEKVLLHTYAASSKAAAAAAGENASLAAEIRAGTDAMVRQRRQGRDPAGAAPPPACNTLASCAALAGRSSARRARAARRQV